MCLSVSGRLRLRRSSSKGLSPDSSYRDEGMIHDMPRHVPRRKTSANGRLSAGFLCRPSLFDQLRDDDIAMIALNFNDALAHGTA